MRGRCKRFHFENMPKVQRVFARFLRMFNLIEAGERNALMVGLREVEFELEDLPAGFDGFRVLFISDLHIDGMDALAAKLVEIIDSADYDICILGGDYTFKYGREEMVDHSNLKMIAKKLAAKSRVLGVLGNHDMYKVAELLDGIGVEMLINENTSIEKDGEKIHIAGIDDSHYYGTDNLSQADAGIDDISFKMMVGHSPERLVGAQGHGYGLYLAGHTHGGQVCLPGGTQIVRGASLPRRFLKGKWKYGKMSGYTSNGAGTSGIAVRFFCKPEIAIITLRRKA
ncbi:MAG: metallophosphoesterase [Planctomycetes bacterium]|nr:metallophosphoesterase [Planctomycetota bacterium]